MKETWIMDVDFQDGSNQSFEISGDSKFEVFMKFETKLCEFSDKDVVQVTYNKVIYKTLRELISEESEHDFSNNEIEADWPTFVGPCELTEKGKEYYKDILDLEVDNDGEIKLTGDWKHQYHLIGDFLWSASGYCSIEKDVALFL